MQRRIFLALTLSLAACAQPVNYQTASGRPERLFNAPPERVRAALATELVNRGYQIIRESESVIEGQKTSDNVWANMLMGSQWDPTVKVRATYTIIPSGSGTRVVGDLAIVGNAGTAFERVTPMSNSKASLDMQNALNAMQV